jgi:hypothetical protein
VDDDFTANEPSANARGGYEPLQSVGHLRAVDTGMATYRLYSSDLIGVALLVALLAEGTSGKSARFPDGAGSSASTRVAAGVRRS